MRVNLRNENCINNDFSRDKNYESLFAPIESLKALSLPARKFVTMFQKAGDGVCMEINCDLITQTSNSESENFPHTKTGDFFHSRADMNIIQVQGHDSFSGVMKISVWLINLRLEGTQGRLGENTECMATLQWNRNRKSNNMKLAASAFSRAKRNGKLEMNRKTLCHIKWLDSKLFCKWIFSASSACAPSSKGL